ncbi:uncharacterized protein LOC8285564 isoform X2 [Ricinus communis]|uniref:uncharacterized protein LOC8285564 isoform X2 n=1 Tax=Ricinus communis TaxID=3988 RepID=UPI0007723AD9|nr:uncharacterized protein LOC8285564 isoform X2 [Ricinus communis]|eukprot:XP_015570429.1 uncharacterized protein LOC8285564 [Ricinus communis]
MEGLCFHGSTPPIFPFQRSVTYPNGHNLFSNFNSRNPLRFPSHSNSKFTVNCSERIGDDTPLSSSSAAHMVLGVDPGCSAAELKAAFRAKVKQFHPDVNRDRKFPDTMIRRVIQAYEILSNFSRSEIIESECLDPFDNPECEAFDIFVNEVLCAGKGCPYSCVQTAPHAFAYASSTGTARAISQGHGEDYKVQLAVGQCPRSCIHYVTPSQRIILEELLDSILGVPYDNSAEADMLYSLIVKATYENNRYQKPKKQPKTSTQHVEWF